MRCSKLQPVVGKDQAESEESTSGPTLRVEHLDAPVRRQLAGASSLLSFRRETTVALGRSRQFLLQMPDGAVHELRIDWQLFTPDSSDLAALGEMGLALAVAPEVRAIGKTDLAVDS